MSTITLPNIRVSSDLTVKVRLKDSGVAIDWSTLNNVKASIYSDAQRALAGRCDVSIDAEDPTLLVCQYAANKPQYVGVNRIVVSAKYHGETKTYDKPAFSFVRWTGDQAGEQITIDDPDVDVEIDVEDVSSSILDEAIRAAFAGAERANDVADSLAGVEADVEAAEALRVAAEESRVEAEEDRVEAEAARVDEEAVRVSAEDARVVAENAREAAEDLREGAEDDRAAAETARETAEVARVAAEALRVSAEGSRESAEAARASQASADHTTAASDHTQAAADHTQAASDHTTAASDHTQASSDHTQAAADHTTAAADHTQAQADHAVMEGYDDRLDSVESEVSQLEAKVNEKVDESLILESKNLVSGIHEGYAYNAQTRVYDANGNYDSTDLLPVTPGQEYVISGGDVRWIVLLPENGVGRYETGTTFTPSTGDKYAVVIYWENSTKHYQVEKGSTATPYSEYNPIIKEDMLPPISIEDGSISTSKLADSSVTLEKLAEDAVGVNQVNIFESKNLVSEIHENCYFNASTKTYDAASGYDATNLMQVTPGQEYVLSGGDARFIVLINESGVARYGTAAATFTPATGDKYAVVTFWERAPKHYQVEKGSTATDYSPYAPLVKESLLPEINIEDGAVTTSKIADASVTPSKISSTRYEGVTDNIFDASTDLILATDSYINTDNGKAIGTGISGNVSVGYTDYFPIDENGLYTNAILIAGNVIGGAYYSAKSESAYISGFRSNSIPYVEGAKYVRFTVASAVSDRMISYGTVQKSFSAYMGRKLIINEDILPDNGLVLALPDKINAIVGDTLQLFYRGIIRDYDPYIYDITIKCNIGEQYPRYYEVTPKSSHIGEHSLQFVVRDRNAKVIVEKSVTLNVASVGSAPSSALNILCVGASGTTNGVWSGEFKRRLTASGGNPSGLNFSNINFVGRMTSSYGANYEATGGFHFKSYTSTTDLRLAKLYFDSTHLPTTVNIGDVYRYDGKNYTVSEINIPSTELGYAGYISLTPPDGSDLNLPNGGTLTIVSGTGDSSLVCQYAVTNGNPFLYDGEIDIAQYATDYCGGATINVVCTELFGNKESPYAFDLSTKMAEMKDFIDMFRAYNPNCKFIIGAQWMTDIKGGTGNSYGADGAYSSPNAMKFTFVNILNALQDYIADNGLGEYVFIANWLGEFDAENAYQYTEKAVNTRAVTNATYGVTEVKEIVGTNGIHPSNMGYLQMADSMYRAFVAKFCQS